MNIHAATIETWLQKASKHGIIGIDTEWLMIDVRIMKQSRDYNSSYTSSGWNNNAPGAGLSPTEIAYSSTLTCDSVILPNNHGLSSNQSDILKKTKQHAYLNIFVAGWQWRCHVENPVYEPQLNDGWTMHQGVHLPSTEIARHSKQCQVMRTHTHTALVGLVVFL